MTKRKDLMNQIRTYAAQHGLEVRVVEGRNHTRVWVGDQYTTIPRHREIPDGFARKILKQIGVK